ncbi:hypothetical protein BC940DRAFT_304716 [Gongronella butleri]|nr:hypothetical protein BC940DRAFT_304716 [Gongronella butleri]
MGKKNKSNNKNDAKDKQTAEIEQYVSKAEHAHTSKERGQFERHANKVHQKVSGHPMKFDSHGHPDTHSSEAKQCPAMHLSQTSQQEE